MKQALLIVFLFVSMTCFSFQVRRSQVVIERSLLQELDSINVLFAGQTATFSEGYKVEPKQKSYFFRYYDVGSKVYLKFKDKTTYLSNDLVVMGKDWNLKIYKKDGAIQFKSFKETRFQRTSFILWILTALFLLIKLPILHFSFRSHTKKQLVIFAFVNVLYALLIYLDFYFSKKAYVHIPVLWSVLFVLDTLAIKLISKNKTYWKPLLTSLVGNLLILVVPILMFLIF